MKIIRVQYTVKPEYVVRNKGNISKVADEVKRLNHPAIKYAAYLLPDGKTFFHFDQFGSEEAHQVLANLESFKRFQTELKAAEFEIEPQWDLLTPVAASHNIFG